MELPSIQWLSQMEREESNYMDLDMNSLDQFTAEQIETALLSEDFHHHFSSHSVAVVPGSPSPSFFSFGDQDSLSEPKQVFGNLTRTKVEPKNKNGLSSTQSSKGNYKMGKCPETCLTDHVIAERRRREKLNQRFIALSSIIPGLKKMDKASVLGDAIKYVKHLEERVKTLEDQMVNKNTDSAATLIEKSETSSESKISFNRNPDDLPTSKSLSEIEAKISDRTVLIRIHCENIKGVLVKMLAEIEKLDLMVVNTSVMPFPGSSLEVTVVAQMPPTLSMAVNDLVKSLNLALGKSM